MRWPLRGKYEVRIMKDKVKAKLAPARRSSAFSR
jgi:hypothetical protein